MCGIALVLSGDRLLVVPSAATGSSKTRNSGEGNGVSVDELKEALRRRGPDSLGCKRLQLCADGTILGVYGCNGGEEDIGGTGVAELFFIGATLHLRGAEPVAQPLVSPSGSVLVYNGEIYGGLQVADDENDTRSLFSSLEFCCSCDCHALNRDKTCSCCGNVGKSVPQILSTIEGPWALVYWQMDSNTLWFGRDAFGRRSLLVHWPTPDDSRFILSSVSPPSLGKNQPASTTNGLVSDPDLSDCTKSSYWEELPCGIYSIHLKDLKENGTNVKEGCIIEFRKHEWTDSSLNKLIQWERKFTVPIVENNSVDEGNHHLCQSFVSSREAEENTNFGVAKTDLLSDFSLCAASCITQSAHRVLVALRESVMLRANVNTLFQVSIQGGLNKLRDDELAPIAVLFSGGLDSMILAALLDQCIDSKWTIDLLNVSFDGQLAPDRISAISGLRELQRISPLRRWRLVEIDTALTDLEGESEHVMSLIHPSSTYMDLNIGIALWLAAGGDGWVDGSTCHMKDGSRYKYRSTSRVLIVGSGADEQCAGYGRHRTKYRLGGWNALDEEMRLDVQRIWKRNMGRDDRCISDHGKEARFPFLDENVIKTLLEIPLWEIAKLDEPVGKGDKKILREVARLLGLQEAALQPKRAIQFGSRIARESNRKNFGSNRAANQASAGSALESAGFDCAHRSAVDALVDVVLRYISHLGRSAAFHAGLAGRALANELDIIQALEEVGADTDGFAGAAATGHCLVGSGVVRDLMTFVDSRDEVPFARPLPRFPVPRMQPQPSASFAVAGRETGMRHVPEWLPVFPDPHTYVRTEVWVDPPATKDRVDKVEQVRQRRKAEKSLLSLQQRLALAGADGFRPAISQDSAEKGKEIQAAGTKRNPFLEPALPPGEKDVSEVDMPPEKKKLSVLEAFAPAIQAATFMELDAGTGVDQSQNQRSIVPKERAPVHLKIGIDKKPLAAALNSKSLDLREDPSFLKEEAKDDRKRRAGMILRASMENPQELTQL
ncbi:uncharacterized protein LOC133905704 [Phragmites australis]|uniref:uncharacterized protein LOC133905704 n=1 Tax=Phragmites australis TaxID=29695 RepID=UPI002D78B306|nr:uncharacterized protein LOC133905704 [Phragmites australis]